MKLPVFKKESVSVSEFITFWSKQYSYKLEDLYNDNIGKELTEERIWALFQWKNGGPLSKKKFASVKQNYIDNDIEIPQFPDKTILTTYLNQSGGAIWRIFWLHCNYPKKYPIYDQHVHRAMANLKGWKDVEIPLYNKKKVGIYINHYLSFWNEFDGFSSKSVDEALWAYGKFLKLGYEFK